MFVEKNHSLFILFYQRHIVFVYFLSCRCMASEQKVALHVHRNSEFNASVRMSVITSTEKPTSREKKI